MHRVWNLTPLRRDRALPELTGRFLARRLLQVVPTVLGIVLIAFLLIHVAPGDPVVALAGEHGDAAYYEFMRERFGLNRSLPDQMLTYFARVVSGDLGMSYVHGRSTASLIMERAPATLLLTGSALLLAVAVSIPLGAFAARRPHGSWDVGISGAVLTFYSAPAFWLGQLAILAFALKLGWLPVQGMTSAGDTQGGVMRALDVARHLVLPAMVLASQELAVLVRLTRTGLIDELARDHIRTARAKGVTDAAILIRHAMPRALLPVVTVIGARVGQLIAGAVVIEIVFGWPGIGTLLLTSLQNRDTPLLLALFLVVSFTVVVANLLTDLVHAALDPRIALS